jgi:uncharacterized protein (DUF4415 family)
MAAALASAPERVTDPECPYDPNDPEQVDAFWRSAVVVKEGGYPAVRMALAEQRRRGPGRAPRKVPTTIRFDPDVLAALKASGKGWQTRVNDAMREWLKTHPPA